MTWNYRLIQHVGDDGVYCEVHQVFYDEDETPVSYNKMPVNLQGNDFEEVWYLAQDITSCLQHYAHVKSKIYGELPETDLKEASWEQISEVLRSGVRPAFTGGGGKAGASVPSWTKEE